MTELAWTQEIPRVDGLYLVREVGDNIHQTEAAVVEGDQLRFRCFDCGVRIFPLSESEGLEYAGPLEGDKLSCRKSNCIHLPVRAQKYGEVTNTMQLSVLGVEPPLPNNLRPATVADIVEGAVIWYKEGDDGPFYRTVGEVLNPRSAPAFLCRQFGCRYGLDGAFVEVMPCRKK
jgi:hypothetical protein